MLYLDSSAIVKLLQREAETAALQVYLSSRGPQVSSVISRVETRRAVARFNWATLPPFAEVFGRLDFVELTPAIRERASTLEPTLMRTLDAIQIATALSIRDDLDALVTYDGRMLEAAAFHGLPTESPG
jgi:predicted nucleic acid-binding protein